MHRAGPLRSTHKSRSPLIARAAAILFAVVLLFPLSGFLAHVGSWQFGGELRTSAFSSIRVSLLFTSLAMGIIIALGTPMAVYIAQCETRERVVWQAVLLIPILLPPLALGILLSLAFGPNGSLGATLQRLGLVMTNSATAFVCTQTYVGMGYYVLGAAAAFDAVPTLLQKQAALLGLPPWKVFFRVTLPLSKLGIAVALSVAWVRTISEFGAVVVTAYYPA